MVSRTGIVRSDRAVCSIVHFLIAATAEARGADLATRNLEHYPMFPNLTAPFWTRS